MDSPTAKETNASGQLTPLQQRIVTLIREIRATYHACTAAEIGRRLRLDKSHISRQLKVMRELGVVDYREDMVGAIWLIGEVYEKGAPPSAWPAPTVSAQPVIRTVAVGDSGDETDEVVVVTKRERTPAQIAQGEKLGRLARERAAARRAAQAEQAERRTEQEAAALPQEPAAAP